MTAVREQPPTTRLDREQLCRLVTTYQAELWRYVRYLGADSTEADDLVQETFLSLARSGFEERSPSETWALIRTAGRHQLLMLRRRQRRIPHQGTLEVADTVWAAATNQDSTNPLLDALRDCVAGLEGKARTIIDYHYTEKLSRQESAERIGISVEGVKTLLRRTRAALKDCVERKIK